jgi:hypothetical protein
MERVVVSLRARLNKKSDVDESPPWNVVAAHLNGTLISVEGGFRGERDLREAMEVLAEYDKCRGKTAIGGRRATGSKRKPPHKGAATKSCSFWN